MSRCQQKPHTTQCSKIQFMLKCLHKIALIYENLTVFLPIWRRTKRAGLSRFKLTLHLLTAYIFPNTRGYSTLPVVIAQKALINLDSACLILWNLLSRTDNTVIQWGHTDRQNHLGHAHKGQSVSTQHSRTNTTQSRCRQRSKTTTVPYISWQYRSPALTKSLEKVLTPVVNSTPERSCATSPLKAFS